MSSLLSLLSLLPHEARNSEATRNALNLQNGERLGRLNFVVVIVFTLAPPQTATSLTVQDYRVNIPEGSLSPDRTDLPSQESKG